MPLIPWLIERHDRLKAQAEQNQQAWIKVLTDAAKTDPKAANQMYQKVFNEPGPFGGLPKIGGKKEIKTKLAGPKGYDVEEVTTGGVEVPREVAQMVEAGLPEEAVTKAWTGWQKPQPQKPTGPEVKYQALKEAGASPMEVIRAFGGYIQSRKPQVIEIGVPNKPRMKQKAEYDFETGNLKRIGTPYGAGGAGGGTAGLYTKPQQIDDVRAFYKTKLQNLTREFGYEHQGMLFIRPENMELYKAQRDKIMADFMDDLQRVDKGQKPKFMEKEAVKDIMLEENAPQWKYVPGQGMQRVK